jgi:hypothetical protein
MQEKASHDLDTLCGNLNIWRKERSSARERIPDSLIREAARLCEVLPPSTIRQATAFSATRLNEARAKLESERRGECSTRPRGTEITFSEVVVPPASLQVGTTRNVVASAEVIAPSGMRLRLEGGHLSASEIIREFVLSHGGMQA